MTLRAINGGDGPKPPASVAEAIEQFAARCAALAPGCIMLVLQTGDDDPEIVSFPAAKSVKLGLLQTVSDVLAPSPFVAEDE